MFLKLFIPPGSPGSIALFRRPCAMIKNNAVISVHFQHKTGLSRSAD